MRTRNALGCGAAALVLAAATPWFAGAQTLVKAAPGAVEVKASHGQTWLSFPDPLLTVRMDKDGRVIATAAPISVAHEEAGPMCVPVMQVAALPSNKDGGRVAPIVPQKCNFDASAATLVLPVDSAVRYARICNERKDVSAQPMECGYDKTAPWKCRPMVGFTNPIPVKPDSGDAWRRAEGWTGTVYLNGRLVVNLVYGNGSMDIARDGGGNVRLTCDAVPCVKFATFAVRDGSPRVMPDALTGRPYRVQMFSGAQPPLTFDRMDAPPGMTIGQDGYLSGTPTTPGSYQMMVGFTESRGCPWNKRTLDTGGNSHWGEFFWVTVKDGTPPVVSSFTTSADTLPAGGGNVDVVLQASDMVGIVKVLSSRVGPGANHTAAMTLASGTAANGTWKISWPVPANTSTSPAAFTIKAWAVDEAGNVVNAAPKTVVVSVPGPALPRIPVPTRP